jgi:hypothetical protein
LSKLRNQIFLSEEERRKPKKEGRQNIEERNGEKRHVITINHYYY